MDNNNNNNVSYELINGNNSKQYYYIQIKIIILCVLMNDKIKAHIRKFNQISDTIRFSS